MRVSRYPKENSGLWKHLVQYHVRYYSWTNDNRVNATILQFLKYHIRDHNLGKRDFDNPNAEYYHIHGQK